MNARYDGPIYDLAERYATSLNTLFVTLFYSSGCPLLLLFASITYGCTYICDKITFLRLYRIPPRYDQTLAVLSTKMMPYAITLHLLMSTW